MLRYVVAADESCPRKAELVAKELPLRCRCGKVRGVATDASPGSGNRVVCYCADCQAFAHFLQGGDVLDAAGGTDIFQMPPSRVRITEGAAELRCMRLSKKGLLRWYTDCCRTPVGNTVNGRVPFVGIIHSFMDHEADGRARDDALGKPLASIHGREAIGGVPANAHATAPLSVVLKMFGSILGWWLSGKGRPSPFFDSQTRAPRTTPRVLTTDERDALRR